MFRYICITLKEQGKIDPHGARINHYDRGYGYGGGSGAGILIVVVIFVGAIILLVGSSNSKKGEITSRSLSNHNPYHNLE